jgi:outer membrane biosynthesis protein TonB
MTTSEFILGHSADDAEDRRQEAHKIVWALLAALILHLAIGLGIALSSGWLSSPITIEEDKPVELTFVDLAPQAPTVSKNPMFMETDESKASVEKPKEQTFESNANSIGASELPATGEAPLPSQQGKDRPAIEMETQQYSLANKGAQPQPKTAPQETPNPSVAPTPQTTPASKAEQLAMLTSTPTPPPTAAQKPQPPSTAYRPERDKTRMSGSITNRGASRVNAVGTPLGRYQKMLADAIGSHWYMYVENQRDLVSIGTARVTYTIDRSGQVKNLKITENSSNEAFANVCLRSFLEAHMPPIPDDVASTLPPEGLDGEMMFTMFSN